MSFLYLWMRWEGSGEAGERPWESEEYYPFYNLAQELDFPVSFHGVLSRDPPTASRYQPRASVPGQQVAMDHAIGFPFENMISLAHIIYMGVLERFPNMRVSFLEGNAGWLPWWIGRLDDHAMGTRRQGICPRSQGAAYRLPTD